MRNQFGRLKSSLEFTDYYHLTNQQLEELLKNTKITQFSIDFLNYSFLITRKMAVLILFTSQNTNITAITESSNEIKLFPYNLKTKSVTISAFDHKNQSSDF
jgi:hypothetical protein